MDRSGGLRDIFGVGFETVLLVDLADHGLELIEREPIRQHVHDVGSDLVVSAELEQPAEENVLLIDDRSAARGAHAPPRRFHLDLAARVDDT